MTKKLRKIRRTKKHVVVWRDKQGQEYMEEFNTSVGAEAYVAIVIGKAEMLKYNTKRLK